MKTIKMIDEISKDKAERYLSKVGDDHRKKHGNKPMNMYQTLEPKRQKGVERALDRLTKEEVKKTFKQFREMAGGGGGGAASVAGPTNVTGPQSGTDAQSATAVDMKKKKKKYFMTARKSPN